jgi:hypothetical protein
VLKKKSNLRLPNEYANGKETIFSNKRIPFLGDVRFSLVVELRFKKLNNVFGNSFLVDTVWDVIGSILIGF